MIEQSAELPDEPINSSEPSTELSDENPWSPPQFGLKSILIFMVPCALVFSALRNFGLDATMPLILFVMLVWIFRGCASVVELANNPQEEDGPSI